MPLELSRPLAFIDLESTGTSPERDRIVEIAVLKLHPDGREEFLCKRVNPGMPIPPDAIAVHGITDADVADEPPFSQYAQSIAAVLADCDYAGFGITRFDLPLLRAEFWRAKQIDFRWREHGVIDAMTIYHQKHPRDLAAAVREYCGREFQHAHSAEEDVRASMDVLLGQMERHQDLPGNVDDLNRVLNADANERIDHDGKFAWVDGEATITFGKNKGRSLRDLARRDPDYLAWILNQDFADDVKEIARAALRKEFPQR